MSTGYNGVLTGYCGISAGYYGVLTGYNGVSTSYYGVSTGYNGLHGAQGPNHNTSFMSTVYL